ncbi:DUF882 domain-containing protein [Roseomonas sp. PWR1]|uniref:Murein endopeptidase K n=1 Tax=Roseomonas nitratireducens TaxID=2820810 RepID=A0ABS4AZQ5_9PROT|nr:DUF882 domain-containing protein [Neoroseomonas nitratireducens]MBP0466047.1 DUF882 domain-containing protein [Neoroseomonas nitratireducens]
MARIFHRLDCPCCDPATARRREVIRAGLGGLAALALAPATAAAQGAARTLRIRRVQTGESFEGVYWRDGRYERDALRRLDIILRDPSMDETTPMDPRLFDVLHTIARHLDSDEHYEVISGYRAPETNAARARQSRRVSRVSLHMSGMAADVRLPGRQAIGIARAAADLQIGGVGLYRRDGFVHLDCGPARRW